MARWIPSEFFSVAVNKLFSLSLHSCPALCKHNSESASAWFSSYPMNGIGSAGSSNTAQARPGEPIGPSLGTSFTSRVPVVFRGHESSRGVAVLGKSG